MQILDEILTRYSVRSYEPRPVPTEALRRILDAARHAPSARNVQEWRFVIVTDATTRKALVPAAAMQEFVGQAPVVIAGCGTNTDYIMRCGQPAYAIDVAIAMEHIALQAVREGLGTCWIGAFHEDQAKRILNVPDDVRIVQLMTLGYPADAARAHHRVPLEEVVYVEKWGQRDPSAQCCVPGVPCRTRHPGEPPSRETDECPQLPGRDTSSPPQTRRGHTRRSKAGE